MATRIDDAAVYRMLAAVINTALGSTFEVRNIGDARTDGTAIPLWTMDLSIDPERRNSTDDQDIAALEVTLHLEVGPEQTDATSLAMPAAIAAIVGELEELNIVDGTALGGNDLFKEHIVSVKRCKRRIMSDPEDRGRVLGEVSIIATVIRQTGDSREAHIQ